MKLAMHWGEVGQGYKGPPGQIWQDHLQINNPIRDVIIIYKIETINSAEYCRDFATVRDGVCIDVWVHVLVYAEL